MHHTEIYILMKQSIRTLYRKLTPSRIFINGKKLDVPEAFRDYFSILRNGSLEPEGFAILDEHLSTGQIFVDVGSNIGMLSLHAAQRVGPAGLVLAFEPLPAVFHMMSQLFALHKLENTRSFMMAVGESSGYAEFYYSPTQGPFQAQAGLMKNAADLISTRVIINSLDTMLPVEVKPDLIKIDVEGAELGVLKGMSRILEDRPKLFIELHGNFFKDPQELVRPVFQLLGPLGYVAYNPYLRKNQSADEFLIDTGFTGALGKPTPLSKQGHGHLVFVA